MASIYDVPFDEAVGAYIRKLKASSKKDTRELTRLLKEYPDLFDPAVEAEIKHAIDLINRYDRHKKVIDIKNFRKKKKTKD